MPKILAIDDKQDNLVSLSALLRALIPDCEVITALSGPEGIEKAVSDAPDAILLDIKMPGMDGFEVCSHLKGNERTRHIPVIMITAVRNDPQSRVKGLNLGADAFFSKPIEAAELASQVKVALRIKKAEDALRWERDSLEMVVKERTAELTQEILNRKQAEEELKAANARLHALWSVASLAEADVKTISDHILNTVTKMTGSAVGFYGFINKDESAMTIHSWSGEAMKNCSMVEKPSVYPIREAGVWGEAIRRREPLILNDYSAEHPAKKGLPKGHVHLTNLLVVPFMTQNRMTSVAAVANRDAPYDQNDVAQLISFLSSIQAIVEGRLAEEARRESEERFRLLSDLTMEGIVIHSNGIVIDLNTSLARLIGYKREELIGKNILELAIHEDDRDTVRENIAKDYAKPYTVRAVRKDGQVFFAELEARNFLMNGDLRRVAAVRDITERKQAEEALRQSAERFYVAKEAGLDSFLIFRAERDGQGHIVDFILTDMNANAERMLQLSREHVIGKRMCEELPINRTGGFFEKYKDVAETGVPLEEEFYLPDTHVPAAWYYHQVVRLADGIAIFNRDITERKRAEAERERLIAAIEQSGEGIIITDAEGIIQYVNPAFEEVTGYTRKDATGQNPRILKSGKQDEAFYADMWSTLTRGHVFRGRLINMRKDGTFYTEAATISPVLDAGGRIVNYVAVERDITENLRLEEKLQQAHRMESIGNLAGGIAHDFNNILSPIMLHAEMAMMDLPPESPLHMNMKQIYASGERAKDLVQQILTFARVKEKEKVLLKASLIVKEALKFLRATIPSTIDIQYEIKTVRDTVLADPTQMHQIVMNLCTNAFHAMREKGGQMKVTLTEVALGPEETVRFENMAPEDFLMMSVSDTGSGILPDIIDKIFEPYFTTKKQGEGTGLGLAVVHGIVKSFGGDITVESEVGRGSAFHVVLPIVDAELSTTHKAMADLPRGTERILFVDDEMAAMIAIQPLLERLGYRVTAKTDSLEALEIFRKGPEMFDLVVTDQTMPHMTGRDLARELMAIRPGIPIILCTGFSEQINEKSAKRMGISGFVPKPITTHELAKTIRQVLDGVTIHGFRGSEV